MIISPGIFFTFFFFLNFDFLGCKRAKNSPKWQNSVCHTAYLRSHIYIIWLFFVVHKCKIMICQAASFIFSKFWFFRWLVGYILYFSYKRRGDVSTCTCPLLSLNTWINHGHWLWTLMNILTQYHRHWNSFFHFTILCILELSEDIPFSNVTRIHWLCVGHAIFLNSISQICCNPLVVATQHLISWSGCLREQETNHL